MNVDWNVFLEKVLRIFCSKPLLVDCVGFFCDEGFFFVCTFDRLIAQLLTLFSFRFVPRC